MPKSHAIPNTYWYSDGGEWSEIKARHGRSAKFFASLRGVFPCWIADSDGLVWQKSSDYLEDRWTPVKSIAAGSQPSFTPKI